MKKNYFRYVGKSPQGRTKKGIVEALNSDLAMRILSAQNIEVLELESTTSLVATINAITLGNVLSKKNLVFFLRQLSSLLEAGVKLLPALEVIAVQQKNRNVRRLLFEVYQDIYSGIPFSEALAKRPKEFPILLSNMVRAAEISVTMPQTIHEMADYFDEEAKLKQSIQAAIRMPIIYFILTIGIAVGMLVYVFPNITALFGAFGDTQLPASTQFFLDASDFMVNHGVTLGIVIASIFLFIFATYKYVPQMRRMYTLLIMHSPAFGALTQMNNQITILNMLSQMTVSGVQTTTALKTVHNVLKNEIYKDFIQDTIDAVEQGRPLSYTFERSKYIDPVMSKMIATGEQTGDVTELMITLAKYYNNTAKIRVDQLKGSIQPIMLIFIYMIIGTLIMALILPMITLGTQI